MIHRSSSAKSRAQISEHKIVNYKYSQIHVIITENNTQSQLYEHYQIDLPETNNKRKKLVIEIKLIM